MQQSPVPGRPFTRCAGLLQRIHVEELMQHPWLLGQQLEPAAPVEQSFQTESDIHSIVERARQRRLQQRNSRKLHTVESGIQQLYEE